MRQKNAWKQHYEHLLNVEFAWSQNLPHVEPVLGLACFVTPKMIHKALSGMKIVEAAGHSRIVFEMLKASPDICV